MIAAEQCVVLDGGVATEIERLAGLDRADPDLWGTWALYRDPRKVLDVHRTYVEAGCNVISTDTWSILSAPDVARRKPGAQAQPGRHWMDAARLGVELARKAIAEGARTSACVVGFSISDEINSSDRLATIDLLERALEDEPPDLILLETMTLVRDPETYETVERLLGMGYPVWLSFRRCRHGVCGVFGQHWGPPEGDEFGRAARRFEEMGVGALMINCLPLEHVHGMVSWLRDFTTLPLGVYPNLGYLSGSHWWFDEETTPEIFAEHALEWRCEGAQIIGGCCGVTQAHIAAAQAALAGTKPGRRRPNVDDLLHADAPPPVEPWRDEQDRVVNPLPFPNLAIHDGVFVPTAGSLLVWKTLFNGGHGKDKRCLDVGCGCGILAVQLALNGASLVHGIDIDPRSVTNTLENAYRAGVAERVTGNAIDLYHWVPGETFDLVVASLYQMPVDPYEEPTGHRPLDYWGRNLIDHLIRLLPRVLAEDGVAYLMQLSIVGQQETTRLLAEKGFEARVVDFTFFPFGSVFDQNRGQITRVEESSDAFHVRFGGEDVMVAYLLEVRRSTT